MRSPDWPTLGDKVKEIVSGFEGIVVGTCEYLWGCEQVLVSRADEKGKPDAEWYDIGRVSILARAVLAPVGYDAAPTGADKPAPTR